jgi:hypothetical protein
MRDCQTWQSIEAEPRRARAVGIVFQSKNEPGASDGAGTTNAAVEARGSAREQNTAAAYARGRKRSMPKASCLEPSLSIRAVITGASLLMAVTTSVGRAQQMSITTVTKAPLAGHFATPAPGQAGIGFWGTDLGLTFKHGNSLRILFGDSWADTSANAIGPFSDDTQGWIDLNLFPTGAAVDNWLAQPIHRPLPGDFPWHAVAPPIVFRVNGLGKVTPFFVYDGACCGKLLILGSGRTPGFGFSNGTSGAFAYFGRNEVAQCSPARPCDPGFTCDSTSMGICSNTSGENAVACVRGVSGGPCGFGATCVAPPGPSGGVCVDTSTYPVFSPSDPAKQLLSVVQVARIGNSDPSVPENYYTRTWMTNKFTNSTARTVRTFNPANPTGTHDYRPIDGAPAAGTNPQVFLWGRPLWIGANKVDRSLPLYFAYADLPQYSATGNFNWRVHYYKTIGANGVPVFSDNPTDAAKLSLSGGSKPENEQFDIVNQMSVSYIPQMDKWVMFYGGDIHPNLITLVPTLAGPNAGAYASDPNHAIHARFASNPWGPWSAPVSVYAPGNPGPPPATQSGPVTGDYAAWGMIHDSNCVGFPCVSGEGNPLFLVSNYGFLYGANIIDAWTTPQGVHDADVYWNVSTWDPYQTVLMKSHIHLP